MRYSESELKRFTATYLLCDVAYLMFKHVFGIKFRYVIDFRALPWRQKFRKFRNNQNSFVYF